nr:L,D-transpeptidase family protein [uncultured Sphingomonas sp.]
MRWLALFLAAAFAGGFFAYQTDLSEEPMAISAPAVAAATNDADPGDAGETDARIWLDPEQRRQASAEQGFKQPALSLLRIARRMEYGDFQWNDEGVPPGPITIRVDLRTQMLSVFRAGHEIGTAVVLYGADGKDTPLGSFPILWKGRNHQSSIYDAPMPYTLRLTGDGVAIHGSNVRSGAATHGCIGIPEEFAFRLFEETRTGDMVTIVRTAPLS